MSTMDKYLALQRKKIDIARYIRNALMNANRIFPGVLTKDFRLTGSCL